MLNLTKTPPGTCELPYRALTWPLTWCEGSARPLRAHVPPALLLGAGMHRVSQKGPCYQPVEQLTPRGGLARSETVKVFTAMADMVDYQVSAGNTSTTQGCL